MRVEICHRVTGKALAQILDDRMKIMWNQLIITVVPLHPASQEVRAANCEVWPLTYAQRKARYKYLKLISPPPPCTVSSNPVVTTHRLSTSSQMGATMHARVATAGLSSKHTRVIYKASILTLGNLYISAVRPLRVY